MPRPEYIKCICHTHEGPDLAGKSWCGRYLGRPPQEFCFTSIDHAVYNLLNGGRLLPCAKCVAAVVKVLRE